MSTANVDALCLGELLIDLVSPDADVGLAEARSFVKAPGGAPANVAVGLARWGLSAGFVGCVGDDAFGRHLRDTLVGEGVDTQGLRLHPEARTTLAFVATRSDGRKDILFYRNPGADAMLAPADLDPAQLASTRLFHFCSVSLSRSPVREATLTAARLAKAAGATISFDPNWRAPLWDDPAEGRAQIAAGVALADVLKVADEELELVAGTDDPEAAVERLLAAGPRLVVITFGADGALAATAAQRTRLPGFAVHAVDTLGAGDAFVAGLLSYLLEQPRINLDLDELALAAMLRRANAAGALATTVVGVIPALPTPQRVQSFLEVDR
ncbi:MAG: hypothetical protein HZB16_19595 [Armatimonadetes bacterium]|nr:hypothetical protein [Armatimonadota bacterium]